MRFKLTFYMAEHRINTWMQKFGVKPDNKWFVTSYNVSFTRDNIDDDFIMGIINNSFDRKEIDNDWVAAICFNETLYCHESVKCLGFVEQGKECFIS